MSHRPRLRLLRDAVLLVVVVVASLAWIRGHGPTADLPAALHRDELPAASCDRAPAEDQRIDSTVAVECPGQFDGLQVVFTGEVVGDVIRRDGGAWVQLNDDAYALDVGPLPVAGRQAGVSSGLAVWLPGPDRGLLAGRSRQQGTILTVTGTFLRADPQDGGTTTIRATDVEVIRDGRALDADLASSGAVLAAALLGAAGLQWGRLRHPS